MDTSKRTSGCPTCGAARSGRRRWSLRTTRDRKSQTFDSPKSFRFAYLGQIIESVEWNSNEMQLNCRRWNYVKSRNILEDFNSSFRNEINRMLLRIRLVNWHVHWQVHIFGIELEVKAGEEESDVLSQNIELRLGEP